MHKKEGMVEIELKIYEKYEDRKKSLTL